MATPYKNTTGQENVIPSFTQKKKDSDQKVDFYLLPPTMHLWMWSRGEKLEALKTQIEKFST